MKAIVYTSRTGFTKRYAELLSEATGVPAWSAKEAAKEVPAHSDIFYMGCLEAGTVKGLDALIERYVIRGVAIVGMNPTGNGDLWTEAKINGGFSDHGARIFYLRGGYAPEKLRGIQKFLMRHMGRSVEKKIQAKGDAATEQDREMVELFRNGGDYVSREALDEIVQWFAEGPHEGMMKASFSLDI